MSNSWKFWKFRKLNSTFYFLTPNVLCIAYSEKRKTSNTMDFIAQVVDLNTTNETDEKHTVYNNIIKNILGADCKSHPNYTLSLAGKKLNTNNVC